MCNLFTLISRLHLVLYFEFSNENCEKQRKKHRQMRQNCSWYSKTFVSPKTVSFFTFCLQRKEFIIFTATNLSPASRKKLDHNLFTFSYLPVFVSISFLHLFCWMKSLVWGVKKLKRKFPHKGDEIGASSRAGEKAFLAEKRNKKEKPFVLWPCFVYKSLLLREFCFFFRCFAPSELISYCFHPFQPTKKFSDLKKTLGNHKIKGFPLKKTRR